MGDSQGRKVSEVSREVTNWSSSSSILPTTASPDLLDYAESWTLFSSTNSSINGSLLEGNKTSAADFKRDEDLAKVEMAVLALIFILTVLGNCVVLLGIFFRRQKMTRMYYFILHLSVADLITAFFNVLTQLFWEITYRFQGGNVLCKFVKYTQILGPYSSSYVLVMTALDRYQAICYPLSNCTWTARRSKVMLGLAWAISLLFSAPQIFIFSYQLVKAGTETEPAEYDCWATFPERWGAKAYVTWYSITVFIIPLIILVFAYTCITRAIWINFNMKAASRNHDNYERRMTRADSDDGDVPSHGEHSQDESVFQRESRLSLRGNASQSIPPNSKSSSVSIYNASKHYLTTKLSTSSTSGSGSGGVGNEPEKRSNKMKAKNGINSRTSTSSCTTQSSIPSPSSLSSRHMSAPDDKVEHNKNSLCYNSQKKFTCEGDGFTRSSPHTHHPRLEHEEQLQLIQKDGGEQSELHHTSRDCHSSKNDLDGNGSSYSARAHMKNGSVKFSGASDTCQHGCYGKRCNFCHSSFEDGGDTADRRRFSADGGTNGNGNSRSSTTILNKELAGTGAHVKPSNVGGLARDKEQNQSYRFSGKSASRHLLLPTHNRFSRKGSKGSAVGNGHGGKQSTKSVTTSVYVDQQQPRTHSVKGISRAKIKTIKLTVTIICCYIFCSSPFIAAQLWSVYDPYAMSSPFFTGPTFTILTLLASLNSCVNPYIFLFFNPNLLQNCFRGIFHPRFPVRRFHSGGSPLTHTLSQNKKAHISSGSGKGGGGGAGLRRGGARATQGDGSPPCATSVTNLSPLISRGEKQRSDQVPVDNGLGRGYHSRIQETDNTIVELVDSNLPPVITGSC